MHTSPIAFGELSTLIVDGERYRQERKKGPLNSKSPRNWLFL